MAPNKLPMRKARKEEKMKKQKNQNVETVTTTTNEKGKNKERKTPEERKEERMAEFQRMANFAVRIEDVEKRKEAMKWLYEMVDKKEEVETHDARKNMERLVSIVKIKHMFEEKFMGKVDEDELFHEQITNMLKETFEKAYAA